MRLIDADKLEERCDIMADKFDGMGASIWNQFRTFVEWMPTIDAVPVVRCRDCKNWDTTWQNDWAKNYHYCPLVDGTRKGDWYCADGERREL